MPKIEAHNLDDIWCQQDDTICHTAREIMALLCEQLGEQLMSHFKILNWPSRSHDITPPDYFL